MGFLTTISTASTRLTGSGRGRGITVSKKLLESAYSDSQKVLEQLNTTSAGLTVEEAETRLEKYGPNEVAKEKRQTWYMRLWINVKNPLVILLVLLGVISFLTGDIRATIMILLMVVLLEWFVLKMNLKIY